MKKKSESEKRNGGGPQGSPGAKPTRVIPSRTWWEGGKALWRSLSFRERAFFVMGIFVPALDQVSRLGSLGVMMKAIGTGIRKPLDVEHRLWLCLVILGATAVTAIIQIFSTRVKKELKVQIMKMLRRSYAGLVLEASLLPPAKREDEVATLLRNERKFMGSANSAVSDMLEFFAAIFLVVVLLIILTWFSWIVGAILLGAGVIALVILKFKVKSAAPAEDDPLADARNALAAQLAEVATSKKSRKEVIESYAENEFDRRFFAEAEARTGPQKKISSVMGFVSAILMAFVFFLVSSKGAFDADKVVWMVVFIFGLRMVISFGKTAMVTWGGILAEKKSLMTLARAALLAEAAREGEVLEAEIVVEEVVEQAPLGSRARIVDYSFSGLNGAGIVSREPMVVEMSVESTAEIEGFYWSFAITREQGFKFLMSKTAEDCGITWNLPKGRSRFRMVTGPLWLPPTTYFAMIGTAEGGRLLDLVGGSDSPLSICVLPDEASKNSLQTRETCDVVVVDVHWDLDFKHDGIVEKLRADSNPILKETE